MGYLSGGVRRFNDQPPLVARAWVLGFFQILGFKRHGHPIDFTIDVMITVDDADVFDFGAFFNDDGAAFNLEVFDQNHRVAIRQHIAV